MFGWLKLNKKAWKRVLKKPTSTCCLNNLMKFGTLPNDIVERIEQMNQAELMQCIERVLTAQSLAEIIQ